MGSLLSSPDSLVNLRAHELVLPIIVCVDKGCCDVQAGLDQVICILFLQKQHIFDM